MAFNLTNYDSYKTYFMGLASSHKSIDGFLYGDRDIAANEGRSWEGLKLWLWPYESVRVQDDRSDNYLKRKQGTLWVGGAAHSASFEDEQNYFRNCEMIVEDIISRILKDANEFLLVTRIQEYSYQQADLLIGSTNYIGCELRFFYLDPTGFIYDNDRWD